MRTQKINFKTEQAEKEKDATINIIGPDFCKAWIYSEYKFIIYI